MDIIFTNYDNDDIISRKNLGKYKGENELKLKGELLSKDHDNYKAFMKIYGLRENNMEETYIQKYIFLAQHLLEFFQNL